MAGSATEPKRWTGVSPAGALPLTVGVRGSGPGAGKDTVADMVCEALAERGLDARRARFGTTLRECVEVLTGIPPAVSQTTEGKSRWLPEWGLTVGQLLQRLGTEAVRDCVHEDAWVLALFRRLAPAEAVVISDVRFPNEVAAVRGRRGVIVNVVRSAAPGDALAGRDPGHASEHALDGSVADFTLVNDGTLDDLRASVWALVAALAAR